MDNLLNQLPCPTLITDKSGNILAVNTDLLALVGGTFEHWLHKPMENFFPPASRIFLQTHVWPMLLSDGNAREIYLKISNAQNQRIPVMMNCRRGLFSGEDSYFWAFFVALERSKFELELLDARNRAESSALALAKRESFVKTVTDAMPGLVAYWDKDLCCRFANKTYLEWFGKLPEAIIGTALQDLLGECLFILNKPYILGALAGETQVFERTLTKADGSTCFTLTNYIPDFDALGAVIGFFVLISDVTTIKTAELELRLAASIFESTVEGIMVTDGQGIILSVNPAFSKITGYTAEEAIGHTPRLLKSNRHDQDFYAALWQSIVSQGCWEGEVWNRRKDGEVFLEWQSITEIHGSTHESVRYVSVFNDITKFWQKDERMRHLAFHDSLTDLPNRTLLMERLDHLLAMTEREQRNIALLFLDLDGFKTGNDKFGHDIGDDLLKRVAQTLLTQVRYLDTVARLGGDEFVILLDNPVNTDEVARIAARIVSIINVPMELRGKSASVGVSIGIAMHPADGHTPTELMKSADTAMYAAKKAGKNTYHFFGL
jgi:diguanylate cyclase (GGDEF)-like protein/PAS domain S-box-containing protein